MIACPKIITTVVLYRSLWCCGAVLLLVAIPLYRKSAVFYTLLVTGFMLMLLGLVAWVRHQTRECTATTRACKEKQTQNPALSVLASIADNTKSLPVPAATAVVSSAGATTPVAEVPLLVPLSVHKAPRISALKDKKTARRKGRESGVKLSENSAVKEFSKFEASSEVSKKTVHSVATKKDGKVKKTQATSLAVVPKEEPHEDAWASLFAAASETARFIYPTVEDIRIERERHTHRPETPDIDRKRRTSMLKEYAMQLGHPRDGSLLPLVQ